MEHRPTHSAFAADRLIASGTLEQTLAAVIAALEQDRTLQPIFFEEATGRQLDFDLRGTLEEVLARVTPPRIGPGRPKLGVVAREVTLLPRHWEWLEAQPNGASAALRRLVEAARSQQSDGDEVRQTREAVGRIMLAVAGNLVGFEEALRALYAGDRQRFEDEIAFWPGDIREYLLCRAGAALWIRG
ncbi:MAG: DUF2239 family protein [Terracidiphilus sp.]